MPTEDAEEKCGVALRRHPMTQLLARHRPRKTEALQELASSRTEERLLLVRLNAFCNNAQPEPVRESEQAADDLLAHGIVADALDKRAIELDAVDRESGQGAERGITST